MSARRYSFVGLLLFGLASTSCSVNPEKTDKRSLGEGAAVPEVPSGTKKEETDVTDSSQVASENLFLKNIVSDLKLNGLDAEKADALYAKLTTQPNPSASASPTLSLQNSMSNENAVADMTNENIKADMTNEGVKADMTNEEAISATVKELQKPDLALSESEKSKMTSVVSESAITQLGQSQLSEEEKVKKAAEFMAKSTDGLLDNENTSFDVAMITEKSIAALEKAGISKNQIEKNFPGLLESIFSSFGKIRKNKDSSAAETPNIMNGIISGLIKLKGEESEFLYNTTELTVEKSLNFVGGQDITDKDKMADYVDKVGEASGGIVKSLSEKKGAIFSGEKLTKLSEKLVVKANSTIAGFTKSKGIDSEQSAVAATSFTLSFNKIQETLLGSGFTSYLESSQKTTDSALSQVLNPEEKQKFDGKVVSVTCKRKIGKFLAAILNAECKDVEN
jgi:hypothetical protein